MSFPLYSCANVDALKDFQSPLMNFALNINKTSHACSMKSEIPCSTSGPAITIPWSFIAQLLVYKARITLYVITVWQSTESSIVNECNQRHERWWFKPLYSMWSTVTLLFLICWCSTIKKSPRRKCNLYYVY